VVVPKTQIFWAISPYWLDETPTSSLPNGINYLKFSFDSLFLTVEAVNSSEMSVAITVDTAKFSEGMNLQFCWWFCMVIKYGLLLSGRI
jgi:hypothetical protein